MNQRAFTGHSAMPCHEPRSLALSCGLSRVHPICIGSGVEVSDGRVMGELVRLLEKEVVASYKKLGVS